MPRVDKAALTAVVVIALDQWTKWLAFETISPGETVNVMPLVSFGRTENEGIAFGLLAEKPVLVFALMGIALAILLFFYVRNRARPGLWLATGMLLGGAIGNAIDRVTLGYVRDFIELPAFPSFNIADVAITFGVILLVIAVEMNARREEAAETETNDD